MLLALSASCVFHLRLHASLPRTSLPRTSRRLAFLTDERQLSRSEASYLAGLAADSRLCKMSLQLVFATLSWSTNSRKNCHSKRSDRITPTLRELHWLPVEIRIDYKILSLVYSCMNGTAPQYLQEFINTSLPSTPSAAVLHPISPSQLQCRPRKQEEYFGVGAFSSAALKLWNRMPITPSEHISQATFKKHLKIYLFS